MKITSASLAPGEATYNEVISSPLQDENKYGARKIFGAPIRVAPRDRDGKLWLRNRRGFQGQGASVQLKRAEGARYPELQFFAHNTVDYLTEERAAKLFVDKVTADRSQFPEELEIEGLEILRRTFLDEVERDAKALAFTAANWAAGNTSTLAGVTGGSGVKMGQANAEEITDVVTFLDILQDAAGGQRPTAVAMSKSVFRQFRKAVQWVALEATTQQRIYLPAEKCLDQLRSYWDVETIHVLDAMTETANPGAASSEADIWDDGLIAYFDTPPDVARQAGGARINPRTFALVVEDLYQSASSAPVEGDGVIANGEIDMTGWTAESSDPRGVWVMGGWSYQPLIVDNTLGGYLRDMI